MRRLPPLLLLLLIAAVGCGPSNGHRSECETCHAPLVDGEATGIEDMHPGYALTCVECHGGDPEGKTTAEAHVQPPAAAGDDADEAALAHTPEQLRRLSAAELDTVDPAYLRWVNPSDYRVVDATCGQPGGCHEAIAQTAPTSIMTTFAGHFNKTRYYAGIQEEKVASVAVRDQADDAWEGAEGTTAGFTMLQPPPLTEDSPFGDFVDHYLVKGCPRCHVWNFGSNNTDGDYRSSGCAGCHVVYHDDGRSRSADPQLDHNDPPHAQTHEITTAIPDNQCEHCHYRGNRIGTMYRGAREKGRLGDPSEEESERNTDTIHGREPGFYLFDEDTSNDVDETPPDVHHTAGLGCVDCHVGRDVHGDGKLYSAHDYQVGIECEDCHGLPDATIAPDDDGRFRNTGGDVLQRVGQDADGFFMTGSLDGQRHPLTQLTEVTTEVHDAAHIDTLECYTCHTAWTQSCFGCHVTVDLRSCGESKIDGDRLDGAASGTRSWVTLDYLGLGMGTDGKITPMAPQEKMTFTVIAACDPEVQTCTDGVDGPMPGRRLFDRVVRVTADGLLGMGYGPVMPHTTSSESQPCDRCHLREDESNTDILSETIGLGSGRFVMLDGAGTAHDLTQVVSDPGQPIVGLGHEGTDVLSAEIVERMLIPRVPDSGLTLKQFPEWVDPAPPEEVTR